VGVFASRGRRATARRPLAQITLRDSGSRSEGESKRGGWESFSGRRPRGIGIFKRPSRPPEKDSRPSRPLGAGPAFGAGPESRGSQGIASRHRIGSLHGEFPRGNGVGRRLWANGNAAIATAACPHSRRVVRERKLRDYFDADVALVGLIDPKTRSVDAYTSPTDVRRYRNGQALDGGGVLPGFKLPLRPFFARMTRRKHEWSRGAAMSPPKKLSGPVLPDISPVEPAVMLTSNAFARRCGRHLASKNLKPPGSTARKYSAAWKGVRIRLTRSRRRGTTNASHASPAAAGETTEADFRPYSMRHSTKLSGRRQSRPNLASEPGRWHGPIATCGLAVVLRAMRVRVRRTGFRDQFRQLGDGITASQDEGAGWACPRETTTKLPFGVERPRRPATRGRTQITASWSPFSSRSPATRCVSLRRW
jgi:hypothetical protein